MQAMQDALLLMKDSLKINVEDLNARVTQLGSVESAVRRDDACERRR